MKKALLKKLGLYGESEAMNILERRVELAAPHWETVFIHGERGSGKELLARALHRMGPARGADPVVVDCASLHAATAESVLFGHERGAFTGAVHRHIGLLELADGGGVFLDEIGALPLELQGRFLRFLEERTVLRIGASRPLAIRTRVIAAANRDLEYEARRGRFLPDLLDRLTVIPLRVPPLRERGDDVLLLYRHFDPAGFNRLSDEARAALLEHPWPGNVRELKHLCARLSVFCPSGPIERDDVRQWLAAPSAGWDEIVMRRDERNGRAPV
ncbi:MAG: AAA domain-containing protein [bacterium]|nr:AAA domain-containing protein [bacterium]